MICDQKGKRRQENGCLFQFLDYRIRCWIRGWMAGCWESDDTCRRRLLLLLHRLLRRRCSKPTIVCDRRAATWELAAYSCSSSSSSRRYCPGPASTGFASPVPAARPARNNPSRRKTNRRRLLDNHQNSSPASHYETNNKPAVPVACCWLSWPWPSRLPATACP